MSVIKPIELPVIIQACFLIAAKYEEIYPPILREWSSKPEEIIKAEAHILKTLDFKLIVTCAQDYLELYLSKRTNETE